MITPKIGFIVYGVHKDGLKDPMGTPFIDDKLIEQSKNVCKAQGIDLIEYPVIIASKQEARDALSKMKKDDSIDGVILFSGTWVWAAHLAAAVRDYSMTGRPVCIWTHPGSQGWRPVGGLVMHGGLLEIGVDHKFVYGAWDDSSAVSKITHFARASHLKNFLNMSTIGSFGGRGMCQTCGVADPSQWMRVFGVDIDSRDTTALLRRAAELSEDKVKALFPRLDKLFSKAPENTDVNNRSIRLYLALKEIVEEEKFDFYTIQSFPGLGDDYTATCFAQSMMLEDGYATSTLSDFNTAMSVLLLTKLSRERVYYGDLQHIDPANNEIKIIGDGAIPPSLAGKTGPAGFAEHGIPTEGEAGGLSVRLICKEGEGVLARLGRVNGEFRLAVCRCEIFEPSPKELQARLDECGIPFWPHGFVRAQCDIEEFIQNWTNEYACLGYGKNLYGDLADFCEFTGVKAVLL